MVSTEPIQTEWGTWLPPPSESLRHYEELCDLIERPTLFRAAPLLPRILAGIRVNLVTGCWEWQNHLDKDDYGQTKDESGKTVQVHRLVYERLIGPIPPERPLLDHLCRHHPCCWTGHTDPKTHAHNVKVGAEARKNIRMPRLFW